MNGSSAKDSLAALSRINAERAFEEEKAEPNFQERRAAAQSFFNELRRLNVPPMLNYPQASQDTHKLLQQVLNADYAEKKQQTSRVT